MDDKDKIPWGTFTQVPNVFLETCELPETAQLLFLRILRHIGHTGGTFTGSIRKLATLVHMSKSTVDRMTKVLRDAKLIDLEYQQIEGKNIMIVTLKKQDLWEVNRYHCKVQSVPGWDSTLPQVPENRPNLGQQRPNLGQSTHQSVPVPRSKSDPIQDKTESNTEIKTDASSSFQRKKQAPYFLREEVKNISNECRDYEHIDANIERAFRIYQDALASGIEQITFRQKLIDARAQAKDIGIEHFFSILSTSLK